MTSSRKPQPAAGTSQGALWAFLSLPGKRKEEASSVSALSATELTQQQHPRCSVHRASGFAHTFLHSKSILNQFITPPAAFFAGAGHGVQMLVAAAVVPCSLQTQAQQQNPYKITPKTSSYSCTMHGRWVVKPNAEHSLGSKKTIYITGQGFGLESC